MYRYSDRKFPAYRYTPGQNAHPTISPEGHSYGHIDPSFAAESPEAVAYLAYGVDLLNHGYYWECHEVCEFLWKQWPRASQRGCLLQSLILLAVAQLHARRGKSQVAQKVAAKALVKLESVETAYNGVDLLKIHEYASRITESGSLLEDVHVSMKF